MKDDTSPEEKLLRLIRGKKRPDISTDKKSTGTIPAVETKLTAKPSIHHLIQKYSYFFDVQKIIWVVFVTSCFYLVTSLIYPLVGLKKIKLPKIFPEKTTESKIEPRLEVKPYEFYQEGIANKQIFGPVFSQGTGKPQTALDLDLMKDINLVGIIAGETPQAVIEDKKTQKTYYVTKGQFIGQMQVEDIQEGKIIIVYQGQRFELHL